jgi:hypothetical protein
LPSAHRATGALRVMVIVSNSMVVMGLSCSV